MIINLATPKHFQQQATKKVGLAALFAIFCVLPFNSYAVSQGDIVSALQHLADTSILPLEGMLFGLSRLLGIWFMFKAIHKLKKYGMGTAFMHSGANLMGPAVYIGVASVFFYMPYALDASVATIWGYAHDVKSYVSLESSSWDSLIEPVVLIVRVVGLISFIRGWVILTRLAQDGAQPGTGGKALTHIIGGVLGINIVGTVEILQNSFGL